MEGTASTTTTATAARFTRPQTVTASSVVEFSDNKPQQDDSLLSVQKLGVLVWAKSGAHPWWPGELCLPAATKFMEALPPPRPGARMPRQRMVIYFGENQFDILPENAVVPLESRPEPRGKGTATSSRPTSRPRAASSSPDLCSCEGVTENPCSRFRRGRWGNENPPGLDWQSKISRSSSSPPKAAWGPRQAVPRRVTTGRRREEARRPDAPQHKQEARADEPDSWRRRRGGPRRSRRASLGSPPYLT